MSEYTLEALSNFKPYPGPLVFIIMDGVGLGARDESDGVYLAHTPVLDALMREPLYTRLTAHGTAVGQPGDQDLAETRRRGLNLVCVAFKDRFRCYPT